MKFGRLEGSTERHSLENLEKEERLEKIEPKLEDSPDNHLNKTTDSQETKEEQIFSLYIEPIEIEIYNTGKIHISSYPNYNHTEILSKENFNELIEYIKMLNDQEIKNNSSLNDMTSSLYIKLNNIEKIFINPIINNGNFKLEKIYIFIMSIIQKQNIERINFNTNKIR